MVVVDSVVHSWEGGYFSCSLTRREWNQESADQESASGASVGEPGAGAGRECHHCRAE